MGGQRPRLLPQTRPPRPPPSTARCVRVSAARVATHHTRTVRFAEGWPPAPLRAECAALAPSRCRRPALKVVVASPLVLTCPIGGHGHGRTLQHAEGGVRPLASTADACGQAESWGALRSVGRRCVACVSAPGRGTRAHARGGWARQRWVPVSCSSFALCSSIVPNVTLRAGPVFSSHIAFQPRHTLPLNVASPGASPYRARPGLDRPRRCGRDRAPRRAAGGIAGWPW